MKLNLWLVANRLTEYDIQTKISYTTDRPISGPLPVMATSSLYVRSEGTDLVCSSDQGTIIIHDMEEREGFLLIQSIFNWYDNWLENIEESLQLADYRSFVHLCAQAFSNPVMLLDSNFLLLGMDCRGIAIRNLPEWRYIYDREQTSVTYYMAMAQALKDPVSRYNDYVTRFNTAARDEEGNSYKTSGLHASFRHMSHDYGRLTVLEKRRPLNPGDAALLILLAKKCSLIFAAAEKSSDSAVNLRVMSDLLEFKPVPQEQLDYHYSIITKKAQDTASRLCLFLFRVAQREEKSSVIELLSSTLKRQYLGTYNWNYHDDLLVMTYVPEPVTLARQMHQFITDEGFGDAVRIGVSLPFEELSELPYHYEQAAYAISRDPPPGIRFFYRCAADYLLENTDMQRKLLACEPLCRRMWNEPDKREYLRTLSAYLSQERATALAAESLYVHRNTINYRIKYLKECTNWDYEDAALRDYLRLSIHYLSCESGN